LFTRVQKVSSVCWNVSFFIPSFFPSLIQTVLTASLKECSKEVNAIYFSDSSSYHLVFEITVFFLSFFNLFSLVFYTFQLCTSFAFSFYSVLCSIPSCVRQMYFFCVFILFSLVISSCVRKIVFLFRFHSFSLVISSCVRKIVFLLRLKNDPP
jgi:hypothetical protein